MDYAWEATPADVAALLPQRTKGEFGKDGEFTNETTPTLAQVQIILDKAAENIASKLRLKDGQDICENGPLGLANEMHALRAAMIVERTYFANQLRTDQSPYKAMKEEYDKESKELLSAYEDNCGGGGGGLGGEEMPKGNFPKSKQWGRRRF
jgi:hypothetical protein